MQRECIIYATMSEESRAEKSQKLKYTLIPAEAHERIVKVLAYGAEKHGERDYTNYSDENIINAIYRHLAEIRKGNPYDAETGELHWSHLAANCIMGLDLAIRGNKEKE